MRRRYRSSAAILTALAACLAAVACDSVLGLLEDPPGNSVVDISPTLFKLSGSEDVLLVRPDSVQLRSASDPSDPTPPLPGILAGYAWLAEPEEGFPTGARLQVQVTTDEGDLEILELSSPACIGACRSFDLGLRDGSHAYELMPRLRDVPARFTRAVLGSDPTARVWVFADDLEAAIRSARNWPGVRYARSAEDPPITTLGLPDPSHFSGALPIEIGSAIPGDGLVQVRERTAITMQYTQPDGSLLRSELSLR